ncbi:MAG TPA: SGNH/GDSL hydrolase family protein, partial [Verrucomicrobiae bacterium]|nr:SGNH/GDSL hydrolase family protein [Verrucomicrobiae bacterium]
MMCFLRWLLRASSCQVWLGLALALAPPSVASAAPNQTWVGTWGCGVQLTEPSNLPPTPLANATLRQCVRVSLGGKRMRVTFSNLYGTNPVVVRAAHVALARGVPGSSAIDPATDRSLTFSGAASVAIPAGMAVVSDPLEFDLPPLTTLAVTLYLGEISSHTITGHPGSRTTTFIQPGDVIAAASLPAAARTPHWYLLENIDVSAAPFSRALVVLGDSITDGRGSTTDGNDRWPDVLAMRLLTNALTAGVAVLNMGIGGNGIFGGLGPSAQSRFGRDVLERSGARWLILFEGVNDLGRGVTAQALTNAYAKFIARAHARNLRVYGATITPFGGNHYFTPEHEATRAAVNRWIRTSRAFDAVVDFDATVRDPAAPTRLTSPYDTGDGLHLNPAGYAAMARSIDLNLFNY